MVTSVFMTTENELLHATAPCPVCGESVHVVADPDSHLSRWCCLDCQVVGTAPFVAEALTSLAERVGPVARA
jgi:hypothetical protein